MAYVWFWILSLGWSLVLAQGDGPLVTIPDGVVRGTVNLTVGANTTYKAFRGIPYAQIPVGNLRFASPVKNDPWTETLNATQDKDACTQVSSTSADGILGSEDCLYINVYTPDKNGKLPVMVFIHGGGFTTESSSYVNYAPDYIIEKDVVFVSFNYRLGVFGFLSTEDLVSPGNWGLKDQVLALQWVQNNIRYFGGDPNKVTIFGQSAGAASISYLVQSNLTTGLFRGAIMESGTSLCAMALTRNARNKAFSIGSVLGIVALSSQTLIDNLRNVDYKLLKTAESYVTASALLTENFLHGSTFGVVQEPVHSGAIFSSKSHEVLTNGEFQKIPLIIGYNSNELGVLIDSLSSLLPILLQFEAIPSELAPYDLSRNISKRLPAGTTIKTYYFGLGLISDQPEAILKFASNDQFNRPIRETVNLMSKYTNVYYYKFSYKGLLGAYLNATFEGVAHAEELNYLFARSYPSTSEDLIIREKLLVMWTNFAKTGNPTPFERNSVTEGLTWKPNTPTDNTLDVISYLNINETILTASNPEQADWTTYQNIYSSYGDPPYGTY